MAVAALLGGCEAGPPPVATAGPAAAGLLENEDIREASGLARSHRRDGLLWAINDGGGPPTLYAIGMDAADRGSVHLEAARNVDWEAIASFELDGESWLLVADIGDNLAARESVTLYVLREPDPSADTSIEPAWRLPFRYPGGPRDAEAVAVDPASRTVFVVSKRTLPAEIYALPLSPAPEAVMALPAGTLASLPRPTEDDLRHAVARNSWHWQPTAMDFSPDGAFAAVMTYRAVYVYERRGDESWPEAFRSAPAATIPLAGVNNAESMAIVDGSLFVTVEGQNAPLYRIELGR